MSNKKHLDFYKVFTEQNLDPRAKHNYIITVDFTYRRVKDLVVKGGEFIAFWNGERWTMSQDDLIDTIDAEIYEQYEKCRSLHPDAKIKVNYMNYESSGIMLKFQNYCKKQVNSEVQFNRKILFNDYEPVREDYSTYQLDYYPTVGKTDAFDEMMSVLYSKEELNKVLWALGALFTGDIVHIEKFLFLYGAPGTGKGTLMRIIKMLVGEYQAVVDLKTLTGSSEFSTADIKEVPLLVDTDCDISKISNEQNLLRLTSHEPVLVRKLYKQGYPVTFSGLLITASNERYRVKNKDSGINRRALVVHPTGDKLSLEDYNRLKNNIGFEIPYIAQKCIDTYLDLGISYYQNEVDTDMIEWGDKMFSFVREYHEHLSQGITLKRAVELYKEYLTEIDFSTTGAREKVRAELHKYFDEYYEDTTEDGVRLRNFYRSFNYDVAFPEKRTRNVAKKTTDYSNILTKEEPNVFDVEGKDWKAQYANKDGFPMKKWNLVGTTLKDLDPRRLHYVQPPLNHIVLDFDIRDENGEKNLEMNLAKASVYPETYTETSKSGGGLHLHYWYDGDVTKLSRIIEPGVEVKIFNDNSALRRKYISSNGKDIATIASGLPLKEEKMYGDVEHIIWTESKLRKFVEKCLNKEHHGATKPEVDFIQSVLNEAADNGTKFDLSDMRMAVMKFAMSSTNQSAICMKTVANTAFSTIRKEDLGYMSSKILPEEELYFFDMEVFSNVNITAFKKKGLKLPDTYWDYLGMDGTTIIYNTHLTLIHAWVEEHKEEFGIWFNPTPNQVEWLMKKPLVGFNNRGYDNHILYGLMMGDSPIQAYQRSQSIVDKNLKPMTFAAAYNVSYADIYAFMAYKKSLKKWQIELGLHHDENEFPWDKPLDPRHWLRVGRYCWNDVYTTEQLFDSDVGQESWVAHKILCEITDLPPNSKTQTLAEAFLFGDDPEPEKQFNWYDLAEEFPGYTFDKYRTPKSDYLGEDPSEGGYVFSKPGIYINGIYVDVDSEHPHSAIAMNYFGKYTPRYKALVDSRLAIKKGNADEAQHAFDAVDPSLGEKLRKYFQDESLHEGLAFAMKIIINIVYGMSSAPYPNKFKDPRNVDNCIAKRGALFMMMCRRELEKRGANVVHIKTDSIKIANFKQEDIDFLFDLAHQYGYNFSIENEWSKMALVNKAELIMYNNKKDKWEAVGATFAQPFVYKTLFTDQDPDEDDLRIYKNSTTAIYLGDRFIGKNAEFYASKSGEDMVATQESDISKSVYSRMNKPIDKYLLVRERQGLTQAEMENVRINKIATELNINTDVVKDIIASGYAPYYITKYNTVADTSEHKWKLFSEKEDDNDIDMTYYNGLVKDAWMKIAQCSDTESPDVIFEGTDYDVKNVDKHFDVPFL